MTQTPLERAARALCERHGYSANAWPAYVDSARAVLMAIREPSKAMYAAGALQSGGAVAAWQATIDAALGE